MTAPTLHCEAHGQSTRITCVDCQSPICPKCLVRTEVGTKCRSCAAPAELRVTKVPGTGRRWTAAAVGAVVVIAAVVAAVLLTRGSSSKAPSTPPPVQGSWTTRPGLASIRGTTAVVTLKNGKVLAAGGGVGQLPVDSAELYDPATGNWSPTGALDVARRGAGAVVLGDGRVLVAGGIAGPKILASAELYDPASGTWSLTGSMQTPRLDSTLTLMPNGKVLATGGTTTQGRAGSGGGQTIIPVATAEIYDPTTGTWSPTGSMTDPRFEATATLLNDGRVLVAGGLGGPGVDGVGGLTYPPLASAEIYDPAVGVFTRAGKMATARADQVAAKLPDGTVLVAGGVGGPDGEVALASAELFDPTSGSWRSLPGMSAARAGAAAVELPNGWVLVAGGETINQGTTSSLGSAEVYDPTRSEWRAAGRMACSRSGLSAALLGDGSVLEIAGDTAFPAQSPVAQGCVDRFQAGSSGSSG